MEIKKGGGKKIIECIPFRNFKEKIKITQKLDGKGKIEVWDGWIYFERIEKWN